ncbi:uncharacterized protein V6R79_019645 [Siganus canaliculatus]
MCQLLFTVGLLMTCLRWTSAAAVPGPVYVAVDGTAVLHPGSDHTGDIKTVTWKYGADKAAELDGSVTICYQQFKGRCELNIITGELTIKQLTLSDSGFYSVEINGKEVNTVQLWVMYRVPKPSVFTWCDVKKTYCLLTCEGTSSVPESLQYRWNEENDWSHSVKVLNISKENKEPEFSCELKNTVSSSRSDPVQNPFITAPVPKPSVSTWCDPTKTYCLLTCEGTTSEPELLQYRWKEENDWSHSMKVLKITKENKEPEFSCELKNPVSSSRSDPVQNPFITVGTVYMKIDGTAVLHPGSAHTGNIKTVTWKHGADKAAEWSGRVSVCYRQFEGRCDLNTRTGELTINHLTLSDSGFYSAEINGYEVNTVQLQVMSPVSKPSVFTWCDPPKTYCLLTCEGTSSIPESLQYRWKEENDWSHSVKVLNITKENKEPEFSCELKNPVSSSRSDPVQNPFITGDSWWIIAVVLVILLIVIVAVVLYYKRKDIFQKGKKTAAAEADAEQTPQDGVQRSQRNLWSRLRDLFPRSRTTDPEKQADQPVTFRPGEAGDEKEPGETTELLSQSGGVQQESRGDGVQQESTDGGDQQESIDGGDQQESTVGGDQQESTHGDQQESTHGGDKQESTVGGDQQESTHGDQQESTDGGVQQESTHGGVQQESTHGGDQQESTHGDQQESTDGGDQQESTVGGDQQESTHGGDQQESTHGGDQQESTVGGDQQESTHGGDQQESTHGGDQQESTVGGDQQESTHGGDQQESTHGGDQQESTHGDQEESTHGDQQESTHGGDQQESTHGGDQQESTHGGDQQESTHGGDQQESTVGGDQQESTHGDQQESTDGGVQQESRGGVNDPPDVSSAVTSSSGSSADVHHDSAQSPGAAGSSASSPDSGDEGTVYEEVDGTAVLHPGSALTGNITKIIWKYNGSDVASWSGKTSHYYGQFKGRCALNTRTGELTINHLTLSDSGRYSVKINRKETNRVQLQVMKGTVYAEVDGTAVLHPGSALTGDVRTVTWRYNGSTVAEWYGGNISFSDQFKDRCELNTRTGELTIKHLKLSDSGSYSVEVNNKETNRVQLQVKKGTVCEVDGTAVLHPGSALTGNITKIIWKYNGSEAASWAEKMPHYYGQFEVRCALNTRTGELTINHLKLSDSGSYSVEINNKETNRVQLQVMNKSSV